MPRRKLVFVPGHYYHIFNRGALKSRLFHDRAEYKLFVDLLKHYCMVFDIKLVALCLMPNHFHIVIQIGSCADVAEFMRRLSSTFSKKVNLAYRRSGTLVQGRYRAKHIHDIRYLRQVCRYVHVNPVKAGLVSRPEDWEFSDYLEWVGKRNTLHERNTLSSEIFPSVNGYVDYVTEELAQTTEDHTDFGHSLLGKGLA